MKLEINIKQSRLSITYRYTSLQTPFHLVKITQTVRVIMVKSQKYEH